MERSENGRAHDYCRCLARAKHRGLLLVLVGRSLATFGVLLFRVAHAFSRLSRLFVAVGTKEHKPVMEPMLFRRNAGLERLEWSGCKAGESGCARAKPCRYLAHRKCRLGAAGFRSEH